MYLLFYTILIIITNLKICHQNYIKFKNFYDFFIYQYIILMIMIFYHIYHMYINKIYLYLYNLD